MNSIFPIDMNLLDQWVVLPDVPANVHEQLPAGGSVLAFLYFDAAWNEIFAVVETAVLVSPSGSLTPIGLPFRSAAGATPVLDTWMFGAAPIELPDAERVRLGLPLVPGPAAPLHARAAP